MQLWRRVEPELRSVSSVVHPPHGYTTGPWSNIELHDQTFLHQSTIFHFLPLSHSPSVSAVSHTSQQHLRILGEGCISLTAAMSLGPYIKERKENLCCSPRGGVNHLLCRAH